MAWEHGFVIDRDPTLRKRVNCRDCIHYDSSDRSCTQKGYYHPEDGYGFWKKCESFMLDSYVANSFEKAEIILREKGIKYLPKEMLKNHISEIETTSKVDIIPSKKVIIENKCNESGTLVVDYKRYQLFGYETTKMLLKSQKKALVMQLVPIKMPKRKKQIKINIGFDKITKRAYIMSSNHPYDQLEELKKLFK